MAPNGSYRFFFIALFVFYLFQTTQVAYAASSPKPPAAANNHVIGSTDKKTQMKGKNLNGEKEADGPEKVMATAEVTETMKAEGVEKAQMAEDDSEATKVEAELDNNVQKKAGPPSSTLSPDRQANFDKVIGAMKGFSDVFIEKFQNTLEVISPPSLYQVLSVVSNIANDGSKSQKELEETWKVRKNDFKPNDLLLFSRDLAKIGINNAFLYYYPNYTRNVPSKVSDLVSKSGGVVVRQKRTLDYLAKKKTNGLIKEVKIDDENQQIILNLLGLQFEWYNSFTRETESELFKVGDKDEPHHFIKTIEPVNYYQKGNVLYAQLPFKVPGTNDTMLQGISAYLVQTAGDALTPQMWDEARTMLKQPSTSSPEGFLFPPFRLSDVKVDFDTGHFPALLASENPDFTNFYGYEVDIKLRQQAAVCVDEKGTKAGAVSQSGIFVRSALQESPIIFNKPFYYIIADDKSGTPYFVSKVTKPMAKEENC